VSLFDFFFHRHEEPAEPADGYLAHSPASNSIMRPGIYEYSGREVKVLGFCEDGKLMATLYLCHKGLGECTEWGTLAFSKLSSDAHEEIWDCMMDKCALVLHATDHGGKLKIKIEVDR